MLKKMKVNRNFIEWLAEILPEYQHEDVSPLGENIHKCLGTKAQHFTVMFKATASLDSMKLNLRNPKFLLKSYFHNLILVKIVPKVVDSVDRKA